MNNIRLVFMVLVLSLFIAGCSNRQDMIEEPKKEIKRQKSIDSIILMNSYLKTNQDLIVSNNTLQLIKAESITGVDIIVEDNKNDKKPVILRNNKCVFLGEASADISLQRIKIDLKKASCRVRRTQKVNYNISGWVVGIDGKFGLKAKREVYKNEKSFLDQMKNGIRQEDDNEEMTNKKGEAKIILSIYGGLQSHLIIDSVKQIETLNIKMTPRAKTQISSREMLKKEMIKRKANTKLKIMPNR